MAVGYLVVQKLAPDCTAKHRYAGVGRIPAFDSEPLRRPSAMDEYVFGDVKDAETNLIPSRRKAERLRSQLNRTGQQFELIYCRSGEDLLQGATLEAQAFECLGYDVVAVRSDYWSIVEDFCRHEWATPYRHKLNENGLFSEISDAESYFAEYLARREPHADARLEIVEVSRVS